MAIIYSSYNQFMINRDPDDPNWTYTQYKATESNNSLVRESSTLLGGRVPSTNQLLWNGYWLSVVEFTEVGGRKFPSPWLVVLLQQTCNQEGEFFKERNSHYSLDQITEANSLGDCEFLIPCACLTNIYLLFVMS